MTIHNNIHESIRQHVVSLDFVKPMVRNTNTHPRENIDDIKASLVAFGQDQVLVANEETREIVKGNGRYLAMRELGWTEAAIIFVDEDIVTSSARGIADNHSSETSIRNEDLLAEELKILKDASMLDSTGYSVQELDDMLAELNEQAKEEHDEWIERTFVLTQDQANVVDAALDKIKQDLSGANKDGRALEFMAADYLGK